MILGIVMPENRTKRVRRTRLQLLLLDANIITTVPKNVANEDLYPPEPTQNEMIIEAENTLLFDVNRKRQEECLCVNSKGM